MTGKYIAVCSYDIPDVHRYKRAHALRVGVALSTPYVDAFGAGIVITLSQAIFEGR